MSGHRSSATLQCDWYVTHSGVVNAVNAYLKDAAEDTGVWREDPSVSLPATQTDKYVSVPYIFNPHILHQSESQDSFFCELGSLQAPVTKNPPTTWQLQPKLPKAHNGPSKPPNSKTIMQTQQDGTTSNSARTTSSSPAGANRGRLGCNKSSLSSCSKAPKRLPST